MQPISRQIKRGILFLFFLVNCGCSSFCVKTNTVDEISPIIMQYIDQKDGHLQVSTIIPPLKKEQKRVITTQAALMEEGRYKLDHKYYREMKNGQLRMVLISKTLARKGLINVINTLILDPEISDRIYLAVVEGDMIGYLNDQLQRRQEQIDFYLYRMMSHHEKQRELTIINIHQFTEKLYDPYADPIMPLFSVEGKDFVYKGSALFQDDRMIDVIHPPEDLYFQMLSRKNRQLKIIPMPAMETAIGEVYTTRHIRFSRSFREVRIDVTLKGRVEEYKENTNLSDSADTASWVRSLESHVESEMNRLIRRIQSQSIDPISAGKHTLGLASRPFSGEKWRQRWPHIQVRVKVHVNLENMGMVKPGKSRFTPRHNYNLF